MKTVSIFLFYVFYKKKSCIAKMAKLLKTLIKNIWNLNFKKPEERTVGNSCYLFKKLVCWMNRHLMNLLIEKRTIF